MKRYELKLVDGGKGVFKVSVVKDPAIESTLVHFSAEKEETAFFTDEEKRVIYSVVMRPNMDIFRSNVNGEPANVYYTEETVEKAQINYFRNNGNSATNINHSELADAEGIFPFESWIVSDPTTDRAAKFGLDVRKGDWVMGLKVDNNELWNEHIKTGKLDGFSVEATNINYEFKEQTQMNKEKDVEKGFLDELFGWLKMKKETFSEEKTEEKEAEATENMAEDDEKKKEEGEKEVKAADESAEGAEKKAETSKSDPKDDEIAELKATIASLKADKVKSETDLEKMSTEKEVQSTLLKETEDKLEAMAKETPAAKSIKNLPTVETPKSYDEMSNFEKLKFNKEKSKY